MVHGALLQGRQFHDPQHGAQEVVEVVGDASGQQAEGLQFLALEMGLFAVPAPGDVRGDDPQAPAVVQGVHDGELLDEERPRVAAGGG